MRAALRIVCVLTASFAIPAGAQNLASLQQGVRIRVQPIVGVRETGTYLGVTGDSLRFFSEKTKESGSAISIEQIGSVQMSDGRSHARGFLKGALFGTAIGFLSGALIGGATYRDSDSGSDGLCFVGCSRGETAILGGLLIGTGGLVVGSIYGGVRGSETWRGVPLGSSQR